MLISFQEGLETRKRRIDLHSLYLCGINKRKKSRLYYFVKLFFKTKLSNVFFPVFLILAGGILHLFENPFIGARNFKRLNPSVVNAVIYLLRQLFSNAQFIGMSVLSNEIALNAFKILVKRSETIFLFEIALQYNQNKECILCFHFLVSFVNRKPTYQLNYNNKPLCKYFSRFEYLTIYQLSYSIKPVSGFRCFLCIQTNQSSSLIREHND